MASLGRLINPLVLASVLLITTGCAEMKALVTVVFTKSKALSTTAFEFDEIRSGERSVCASFADRSIRCFGSGESGNLGSFNSAPVELEGPVRMVATGKQFTCTVSGLNAKLTCFGTNRHGQLGNGSILSQAKALPVVDLENNGVPITGVKELSAGDSHACALLQSGRAVCWGDNSHGQLGNGKMEGVGARSVLESERNPRPLTGVRSITAGANSTCIIVRDDSAVYCFGERFGEKRKWNWVPARVEYENNSGTVIEARQLGVGRGFGCALTKSSQVVCWGRNDHNQLGLMNPSPGLSRATEVEVSFPEQGPLKKITQITVGDSHACALHREDRSVFCWGKNEDSQLGNTSVRGTTEQVAIGSNNLSLRDVKEVRAGSDRTCIISMRDEIFCWGNGLHGLLGNQEKSSVYPVHALDSNRENLTGGARIAVGFDHTCMIDQRDQLYCFGLNSNGQMGLGRFAGRVIDVQGKPVENVVAFDSEGSRNCVIHGERQELGCFGGGTGESLKASSKTNSFVLRAIAKSDGSAFTGLTGVAIGSAQICVIEKNQTITCLSRGDAPGSPSVVSSSSGVVRDVWQIRIQGKHGCALTQDSGEIYCWGQDSLPQVAAAERALASGSPASGFIQIALDRDRICGIRGSDRVLYCGTFSGPVKVDLQPVNDGSGSAFRKVLMVSGGSEHFCAIQEPGRLICWGSNSSGQIGLKGQKEALTPIQVQFTNPRLVEVVRVSAGGAHTCVATANDPLLFCFGESFFGGSHSVDPVEYPL